MKSDGGSSLDWVILEDFSEEAVFDVKGQAEGTGVQTKQERA